MILYIQLFSEGQLSYVSYKKIVTRSVREIPVKVKVVEKKHIFHSILVFKNRDFKNNVIQIITDNAMQKTKPRTSITTTTVQNTNQKTSN